MAGVAYYNVAGMRLGSHHVCCLSSPARRMSTAPKHETDESSQIAMGWLATLFGGTYYAMSGPKKAAADKVTPPINASSSDEADFIKCVISTSRRPLRRDGLLTSRQEVHGGAGEEAVSGEREATRWALYDTTGVHIEACGDLLAQYRGPGGPGID